MGQNKEKSVVVSVGQVREEAISVTPMVYRVLDSSIGRSREVQVSGQSQNRVSAVCFRFDQLGHKSPVYPQRKKVGLAARPVTAPPKSSSQLGFGSTECSLGKQLLGSPSAQTLNQSHAWEPLTCWVCNQPGHIKRFCTQPGASLGVLQPRQVQPYSTGHGQYHSGGQTGQISRALGESSSQAPVKEICSCSRCGQLGHICSSCPWLVSS
ncbi:DNA-binding protein HEXBP-like [Camellia sinensis]|uniref:DNA-binding protein HEXBP-like n=1 Tax=Camellia sinensis TaxID=4442 RepID=UPI0010357AD1|nr:DNA-binding protein HEXBP-like [Camellia sinensis]